MHTHPFHVQGIEIFKCSCCENYLFVFRSHVVLALRAMTISRINKSLESKYADKVNRMRASGKVDSIFVYSMFMATTITIH